MLDTWGLFRQWAPHLSFQHPEKSGVVSVTYRCENYPQTWQLETTVNIYDLPLFLRVRNWGTA